MRLTFVVCFFCLVQELLAGRIFHNGRRVGGNFVGDVENKLFRSKINVSEKWVVQKLNNFDPTDERKWKQRYFVNENFFHSSPNGPVFLLLVGEGPASITYMTNTSWIDYAKKFRALYFGLEHRYYGKSHPTSDLSTKNLQYLNSQQALADTAFFIESMNKKHKLPKFTKWIVFGRSYSGALAAWMRVKYPHLVHAAVCSSAPLLAIVDFKDYFRVVDESLETYSEKCVVAIKQGTAQIELLSRNMTGQRNINDKFKLCDPIQNSTHNDMSRFYDILANNFGSVVQYNKDNRESIGANITIEILCNIMLNESIGPSVNRLAAVNELILNTYNEKCFDYKYDNLIMSYKNVSWNNETIGGRQWLYQTCTEFGFFQTSSYRPQVFGDQFPVQFFVQQCQDIFGSKFNATFLNDAVERTNTIYGGLDIDVKNAVFVHGSIDPWHALGITKTIENGAPAIYIEGTAHCADMYPKSDKDLPQLKAAREEIADLIDIWLRL